MTRQATSGTVNKQQPQFSPQRIYLRDLSFESPKFPEVFRQGQDPSINLNLNTRQEQLNGGFYEVVLTVPVTVENDEDTTAFIAEIQQAGISSTKNLNPSSMSHTLGVLRPNILFPCAREALDNLVVRGSFPALTLSPVNFDTLYAQEIACMWASDEIPTSSVQ